LTGPPPSAAWSPGDDIGDRRFARLSGADGLGLEAGGHLGSVDVAYETWGELDAAAGNAVLVLHALTLDSHVSGPTGPGHLSPGWWPGMIGPGAPIDTDRFFVVCPNVLGGCQGTTGPASVAPDGKRYGSRFPIITIRDQVKVEAMLADHLGIDRWRGVVGGSMGGMRVLEWCVGLPDRVDRAVVVAVGAAATADQIGLCSVQIRAIRADPAFAGGDYYDNAEGPAAGMAIARGIGQLSYRTSSELDRRFGREAQGVEQPLKGGRYSVESYLEHQGNALLRRFDANSYVVLSEAMNHHDVGRGRGGIASALSEVTARMTIVGISSDRLYPVELQHELARMLPGSPDVRIIESLVGHDGFLLEVAAIGAEISAALE
jgi:homoserine O-acetyltransferase/O-succinyltransferase